MNYDKANWAIMLNLDARMMGETFFLLLCNHCKCYESDN